jgi:hypothetical protein
MNRDYTDDDIRKMYDELRRIRGEGYLERARRERVVSRNRVDADQAASR